MIFFLATNLRSAKSFKSSILHLIRRKPRILVSYDDPFQAGNSLVGSPSMNPKTWIHKPPTLPPTARQRQGPSRHVSTLLRAGLGHRHNGTEVFWNAGDFHLLDLLFDISCWHRHLWWHESTIVTSAFHPQKTSQHQFFFRKKKHPKKMLSLREGMKMKPWRIGIWNLFFWIHRTFSCEKLLKFEYSSTDSHHWILHCCFFFPCFCSFVGWFLPRISFCNRILFHQKKFPVVARNSF